MKDIRICVGSSCFLKGAHKVMDTFAALVRQHGLEGRVTITGAFCLERCRDGVAVSIDGTVYSVPSPDAARALFEECLHGTAPAETGQ